MSTVCTLFRWVEAGHLAFWHFTSSSSSGRKDTTKNWRAPDGPISGLAPIPSESKIGSRTSSTCLAHHIPPMPSKSPTLLAIDPTSGRREENGTSSPIPYTVHQVCSFFVQTPHRTKGTGHWGSWNGDVGGIGGRHGSLTSRPSRPPHRDAHADSFPPPHSNPLPGPLTDDGRDG